MKMFIVYLKGIEVGYINAKSHNEAENIAQKKYNNYKPYEVSVAYTEL